MSSKPLTWQPWAGFALIFAALIFGALAMRDSDQQFYRERCAEKWALGGYATRYERNIGCMVEIAPGRFVPESNVKIELRGQQ